MIVCEEAISLWSVVTICGMLVSEDVQDDEESVVEVKSEVEGQAGVVLVMMPVVVVVVVDGEEMVLMVVFDEQFVGLVVTDVNSVLVEWKMWAFGFRPGGEHCRCTGVTGRVTDETYSQ